jgi:hypothetical protein
MENRIRRSALRVALVTSLIGIVLAGCFLKKSKPEDTTPDLQAEVPLQVDNHGWTDVSILAIHGGVLTRVGQVDATKTETFILPVWMLSSGRVLQLRAEVIGSSAAITTERLVVQPGQYAVWSLEYNIARSSLAVY